MLMTLFWYNQHMDYLAKAAKLSHQDVADILEKQDQFSVQLQALQSQLDWFKQQVFGQKSERHIEDNPIQLSLLGSKPLLPPQQETEEITYKRRKGPKNHDDSVNDKGLRFDETVPVKEIRMSAPELQGKDKEQYVVIDEKVTCRLAQRPASYVVLKYIQPVVKSKVTQYINTHSAPTGLFDKSIADVSFIAGMLLDKFLYHQPLYRQHQKLKLNGITLARSTLTNLTHRSIDLLEPIFDAQWDSCLQSKVLAMDETPVKAGPNKNKKGKMKQAYYWPVLGDQDEICFAFAPSRGKKVVQELLEGFSGTLLTDGYGVYERYAVQEGIELAQCWIHGRRYFVKAQAYDPAANEGLNIIGRLYDIEKQIKKQGLDGNEKLNYRQTHSLEVVDEFFDWCKAQCQREDLLPKEKMTQALNYMLNRQASLRVFLTNPGVAMDTNALERGLRVIPMGKKNWMFCWTEVGAKYVGIIQSLLVTCKMHGINPYVYLVDVLQRVATHPAKQVHELTPRLWKEKFVGNPLTSDLDG
ncbi:MAG: transposase [Oleispira sp.]|jgi:transposase